MYFIYALYTLYTFSELWRGLESKWIPPACFGISFFSLLSLPHLAGLGVCVRERETERERESFIRRG